MYVCVCFCFMNISPFCFIFVLLRFDLKNKLRELNIDRNGNGEKKGEEKREMNYGYMRRKEMKRLVIFYPAAIVLGEVRILDGPGMEDTDPFRKIRT